MKRRGSPVSGIGAVPFAVLLACARPQVTLTPFGAGGVYPATPDSVAIPRYATTKPECPYDEIAAITAEGHLSRSAERDVLSALLRSADCLTCRHAPDPGLPPETSGRRTPRPGRA